MRTGEMEGTKGGRGALGQLQENQQYFSGWPRARRTDPATSHEAAQTVDTTKMENAVLSTLGLYRSGLTSKEIADLSGFSLVTISPRMKPLEAKGKVVRTTDRRDKCTVWRINS